MRWFGLIFSYLLLAATAWLTYRLWPRPIAPDLYEPMPLVEMSSGSVEVGVPGYVVLADVGHFEDELRAYLYFEYVRSLRAVNENRVYLTASGLSKGPKYRVLIQLESDLRRAVPFVMKLRRDGHIGDFGIIAIPSSEIRLKRRHTELFLAAYTLPVRRKLEALDSDALHSPLAQFLLFKSKTDRRVRKGLEPVPEVLSREQAIRLAGDIITVAEFYSLPIDFFLGIGAMENNYMDVRGDLNHAVWKRRAEKGDIVLRREKGRVLVHNYSIGRWQITRETLRYVHRLYKKDTRDYSLLPEHLRPPEELQFEPENPEVLTTYAGLLFRDLLDRFDGDVEKAVGAYNGGFRNPNMEYAAGVRAVAEYARKVLEQAAVLNGHSVANSQWIMPAR